MEGLNHKSLERVVSQRAFQMGSSFPCQICVVGFLCGVCITSVFLAALTSFSASSFGGVSISLFSPGISAPNSSTSSSIGGDCRTFINETEKVVYERTEENVSLLYKAWSDLLGESTGQIRLNRLHVPRAPHLQDCKLSGEMNHRLDARLPNGSFPPWTVWKGLLDYLPLLPVEEQLKQYRDHVISQGAYPPWIMGSDEENYPLTRKVQRDLWLHQHPVDCNDPSVKFLVADWERLPGFGIGAQLAGMCGLLAIAINEKRVLVTDYYNRADHAGCKGSSRSRWSCYFIPETSPECRKRAFELKDDKAAWGKGIITVKENYTSKEIWAGHVPRAWGNPWSIMQPTTEINGSLLLHHRKMDRRWWRAQAIHYLMRFQSEYTCNLMNIARHTAFGWEAAKMVLASSSKNLFEAEQESKLDIERFVWSNHKPWLPRPLLSMHVRMGDKACEMKVVGFDDYMKLAEKVRRRFPHLNRVWLSTEMQDVVDRSKSYEGWRFHYTNVTRQAGNITMATYEASLGRETSTNYPLVNFLMATEADFFIGALGSTWCFLIDGMRNTGGKVMSGYLSVNKDRFW
ncbi:uncharacterized protein LOC121765861 [Salvia splendens]|uniref:uncharacterized protein LOC121765861 n=1 Tax=Salvia splendens TaxID=180675 RepID=UPI001C27BF5A|nr:uncharacterized protein LOC121765861 [Salvia splendens]XP_042018069.1 uncharacterized protein LOC121765861 [Salvia splendens]